MRKVFTILLVLFVGFYSTAALCLCSHEEVKVSSPPCHEEQGEASHSKAESSDHHSNSSQHSQEKSHNCCCIHEASDLPTKLETASFQNKIQSLIWLFAVLTPFSSSDLVEQYSFRITHDLSPPLQEPLYLKKSSFLI